MTFENVKEAIKELKAQYKVGQLSIGALILAVIFVVIALALAPTIANSANAASSNANATAAGTALFNLVPVVFAAVVIVGTLAAFGLGR